MVAAQDADRNWRQHYFARGIALAAVWTLAYTWLKPVSNWIVASLLQLDPKDHIGATLQFFLYDTAKILLLLIALIYILALLRASINAEVVRDYLAGKKKSIGFFLGAMFGSITPFCSCSSIPLFLGFTAARIPFGITMSFLITSPLINEIAVILLWGLLGWKFTVLYVLVGMGAGILGGFFMDAIRAERWLQPFFLEIVNNPPEEMADTGCACQRQPLSLRKRHDFAWKEARAIFKRVWKWVLIGVAIGALLHGFVPANWFAEHLGSGQWWTVPAAVLIAIPLYSNVTGIVPIMESLLMKGLPVGTTMAFCMSSVAASIPEMMLLREIMTIRLQAVFLAYLWFVFTLVGWIFNLVSPYLLI